MSSPSGGSARDVQDWRHAIRDFLYGLTAHEFVRHAMHIRRELEGVFMVVTYGDLIGVPVLPPYYSLRLLPYVVPQIETWKREVVRRKEFWDREEYDLIEM
jgi:hypothetical protein